MFEQIWKVMRFLLENGLVQDSTAKLILYSYIDRMIADVAENARIAQREQELDNKEPF